MVQVKEETRISPTPIQRRWLVRGLSQPGGKLPLFDLEGQKISARTVRFCIEHGWAEPWFTNPIKPDWLVCRLTHVGRQALGANIVRIPIGNRPTSLQRDW
ncbi:MAG: hypothetical protein R3E60_04705 [Alphaproteobacteria bacterium]